MQLPSEIANHKNANNNENDNNKEHQNSDQSRVVGLERRQAGRIVSGLQMRLTDPVDADRRLFALQPTRANVRSLSEAGLRSVDRAGPRGPERVGLLLRCEQMWQRNPQGASVNTGVQHSV